MNKPPYEANNLNARRKEIHRIAALALESHSANGVQPTDLTLESIDLALGNRPKCKMRTTTHARRTRATPRNLTLRLKKFVRAFRRFALQTLARRNCLSLRFCPTERN